MEFFVLLLQDRRNQYKEIFRCANKSEKKKFSILEERGKYVKNGNDSVDLVIFLNYGKRKFKKQKKI